MRAFEILLILVNLVTLIICLVKRSKNVRLGATVINVLTLLLHGMLEGLCSS